MVGHLEVLLADDSDGDEEALELALEVRDDLLDSPLGRICTRCVCGSCSEGADVGAELRGQGKAAAAARAK